MKEGEKQLVGGLGQKKRPKAAASMGRRTKHHVKVVAVQGGQKGHADMFWTLCKVLYLAGAGVLARSNSST